MIRSITSVAGTTNVAVFPYLKLHLMFGHLWDAEPVSFQVSLNRISRSLIRSVSGQFFGDFLRQQFVMTVGIVVVIDYKLDVTLVVSSD